MLFEVIKDGVKHSDRLLYSIQNTGNLTTKVALIPPLYYEIAMRQLSVIHSILLSHVSQDFHDEVFIPGKEVCIAGQLANSISLCSYSAYADRLLGSYNPQDGEESPTPKRYRHVLVSYITAVTQPLAQDTGTHVISNHSTISQSNLANIEITDLVQHLGTYFQSSSATHPNCHY